MLVMAIEGARQLAEEASHSITAYQLRNVAFERSFIVPENATTFETQLHLHPLTTQSQELQSHEFSVFGFTNNAWSELCHGCVDLWLTHRQGFPEQEIQKLGLRKIISGAQSPRWQSTHDAAFYEGIRPYGFDFGPAFQSLESPSSADGIQGSATIRLDKWSRMNMNYPPPPCLIHPIDLDGILQVSAVAHSQGGSLPIPLLVPSKIDSLWISHKMMSRFSKNDTLRLLPLECSSEEPLVTSPDGVFDKLLRVYSVQSSRGVREASFSIAGINDGNEPWVLIEGFRTTFMINKEFKRLVEAKPQRLCYQIDWKPDIDFLRRTELSCFCNSMVDSSTIPAPGVIDRQELVALYYIRETLRGSNRLHDPKQPPHITKYIAWMQHQFDEANLLRARNMNPDHEDLFGDEIRSYAFFDRFSNESTFGKLIVKVAEALKSIFEGLIDPLDLLFSTNLASEFYASQTFTASFDRLAAYVDLLAHKNPNIEILEVGAGTGGATKPIIDRLVHYSERSDNGMDIPRFKSYTYTDISPAFFEEAQKHFQAYSALMEYSVLDIEKNVLEQGFASEQYDLIICSMVLHATADLRATLRNIRKLLRPGGKVAILEPSSPHTSRLPFVFGLLPGWWLSTEEERKWSPLLSPAGWATILSEEGFDKTALLPDYEDHDRQTFSIILSGLPDVQANRPSENVVIAINEDTPAQHDLANRLQTALSAGGHAIEIASLSNLPTVELQGRIFVSLLELGFSYFDDIADSQWSTFKRLVNTAKKILWVTKPDDQEALQSQNDIVTGVGRNIRSEYMDTRFIQVSLERKTQPSEAKKLIVRMFNHVLRALPDGETEYYGNRNHLELGRIIEAADINRKVHEAILPRQARPGKLSYYTDQVMELGITTPGNLDTLAFQKSSEMIKPGHRLANLKDDLAPTEVELAVMAVGLNFKDVLIALGQIADSNAGSECSGFVRRAGRDSGYAVGDKVCCCTSSGWFRNIARADASAVMRFPDSMPFAEAAGIPIVYLTAYYSLVHVANLKPGETVLIHSGAGGVGQAAITIASRCQARIITTVGSEEKRKLLMDTYGIANTHILSSRSVEFAIRVRKLAPLGVDVVVNSLKGELLEASWRCIAPLGRFVELGKADIETSRRGLPMAPFANNVTFSSVSLDVVLNLAKPLIRTMMQAIKGMLHENIPITIPQPLQVYTLRHISEAFRLMASGKSSGKIVIDIINNDEIPVSLKN